ncbi:MAG: 3-phosphoshikimate 1-carboxyvinyltransferase [Crocinitomicaceae bacterium]|nr:3-phosphoshikimate 1-carboxyvinyltransferase [Crocinitomicaceae bacterium]
MIIQVKKGICTGSVLIPSSKSDGQRSILAAALNRGVTRMKNIGSSADELAMLENIKCLGASVKQISDVETEIRGVQNFPDRCELNAGESGLGVRLITSVCAAHEGIFEITGEGSLLTRPQDFFENHLTKMGVRVQSSQGYLPISIQGKLTGGELEIDGSASSQFLSGLLMALPLAEKDSVLKAQSLKSIPYVQMTLNTLAKFGIEIEQENYEVFRIKGKQNYDCHGYSVESDWSSAGYWLVASALGHPVCIQGLSMESSQADIALLKALENANCRITHDVSGITIDGQERKPFQFDATHCPDLFPALVVLAAFCEGKTEILGVHRLKNKESDRGVVLQKEFGKLGLSIDLDGDRMTIHGGVKLKTAKTYSHNDHRIAMCLAIAGTFIEEGIEISGAEAVKKSYPSFWDHLEELTKE